MMIRRLLSFFIFLCVAIAVSAQSCYQDTRQDGLKMMKGGQYQKAIHIFDVAKKCPDRPKKNDLDALIADCKRHIEKPKPTPTHPDTKKEDPKPEVHLSIDEHSSDFSMEVSDEENYHTFFVTSPGKYTVTSDSEWCHIKDVNASNFENVVEANARPRPRTATLKAVCGNENIQVRIEQDAHIPAWAPTGTTRRANSTAAEMPKLQQNLKLNPNCRLAAITSNRRGVTISGDCDFFATDHVPETFRTILSNIQKRKYHIDAIALTGSDYYCVVWNGNKWDGKVPAAMKEKLNDYIDNGDKILDFSISDDGNFVIITNNHVYASRKSDMDVIKAAEEEYGPSKSISITTYGMCAVCEYGIVFRNIPDSFAKVLKSSATHPDKVTYTDSGTYVLMARNAKCEHNIR